MKKRTIIYGNGLYARLIHQKSLERGGLEVAAFTADREYIKEKTFQGLPLVAFEDVEKHYPVKKFAMLVVAGFWHMRNREVMFNKAKTKGYSLENYIIPGADVPKDIVMGENNIINEGVMIGPFNRLGDNNMLQSKTYIAHDCEIQSHCYISPGCTIGGNCKINGLSFIGIGATLIDSVVIERETLIGAGSLVLKNTEPYSKYMGSPARKVGEHAETGIVFERRGRFRMGSRNPGIDEFVKKSSLR